MGQNNYFFTNISTSPKSSKWGLWALFFWFLNLEIVEIIERAFAQANYVFFQLHLLCICYSFDMTSHSCHVTFQLRDHIKFVTNYDQFDNIVSQKTFILILFMLYGKEVVELNKLEFDFKS